MNVTRLFLALGVVSGILQGQTPNPLSITPTIPGQFQLSWPAANQRPYQIEAGPDLVTWAELGPVVVGTGSTRGMLVAATDPKFFYRLREGAMRPGFDAIAMDREDDHTYDGPNRPVKAVPLGFSVKFYGETYSSCYVNNNGNITFDGPLETWNPVTFQSAPKKMVAAFWADVDTRGIESDVVRFSNNATLTESAEGRPAFGVTYRNVGYFDQHTDRLNSFQIVLIDRSDILEGDFDIEFNYNQIQWDSGDYSLAYPARVGIANRDDLYIQYEGSGESSVFLDTILATGAPNYQTGLIYSSLNGTVPGRIVFYVRNGQVTGGFSVDAGPDQIPAEEAGGAFQLQGSINPTGTTGVVYLWSQISGPADAVFSDSSSLTTAVVLPIPGEYEFKLLASKAGDLVTTTYDTVLIKHPGVYSIFAGENIEAESSTVSLDQATVSVPSGVSFSVHWTQESGDPAVFSNENELNTSIALPGAGSFLFLMTVTTNHVSPFVFTSYIWVDLLE
jgi:hypothetical protein